MQTAEETKQIQNSRARAEALAARLLAIDFDSPENGLPQELIQAEGYREMARYLAKQLQDAQILRLNTEGIDRGIGCAVDAFASAILQGRPNTAQWACSALSSEILMLRQDIPASDAAWAGEIRKAREDTIGTYREILAFCEQLDDNAASLERLRLQAEEKREEYNGKLAGYNTYRVTEQGMAAQIELERCADTPGRMSEAAKGLRSMLNDLAILKAQYQELAVGIDMLESANERLSAGMEAARNKLAVRPNIDALHDA